MCFLHFLFQPENLTLKSHFLSVVNVVFRVELLQQAQASDPFLDLQDFTASTITLLSTNIYQNRPDLSTESLPQV